MKGCGVDTTVQLLSLWSSDVTQHGILGGLWIALFSYVFVVLHGTGTTTASMTLQFTLLPIVRDSGTCVSYKKCFVCATRITQVCDPTGGQAKKLLSHATKVLSSIIPAVLHSPAPLRSCSFECLTFTSQHSWHVLLSMSKSVGEEGKTD